MRLAPFALLLAAACSHGDAELRAEQAKARHYRDAYESQAQEIQQLKKRVAEMEAQCARAARGAE
jgi:hypothetical protein